MNENERKWQLEIVRKAANEARTRRVDYANSGYRHLVEAESKLIAELEKLRERLEARGAC